MKGKKIFMFCPPEGPVPVAGHEKRAAMNIINKINSLIGKGIDISLWLSDRAVNTRAGFSTSVLLMGNIKIVNVNRTDKLFANGNIRPDLDWLIKELEGFKGENIVIVCTSEYLRCFADKMNFTMKCQIEHRIAPGPFEGLFINNGVFSDFSFRN